MAAVLGGDLQAVDEDLGAARVDAVGPEGEDDVGERGEDGVGVFQLRQVMGEGGRLAEFAGGQLLVAFVVVEVAEVLLAERGRRAFLSAWEDVAAFDVHASLRSTPRGGGFC